MIAEVAARLQSAADASFALHLAGVAISCRHVQRLAAEIGTAMAQERDHKAIQHRRRALPARVAAEPEVVAVEVDGGRLRTREVGCGPGVHAYQNKEDKMACLVTLKSAVHETDPQPEPPESFLEPRRVQRLVQQMQGLSGDKPQEESGQEDGSTPEQPQAASAARVETPRRQVRTCVASLADCHAFGPMVAAEAQERDFCRAKRRAFLGDGAAYNWGIQRGYFGDFEAITDFLHVLCYLYLAAWGVGSDEEQRWSIDVGWLRACWQGHVQEVIEELRIWQGRVGEPPQGEELDAKDPRRLVAEALSDLENNQSRMDYPRYRQQGLPGTSSLVESLVGECNARVKSRQKYWNRPEGAEAILQLRAAVLSEDDRLDRFFAQRPGNPYRRRKAS
ncbi:MAG: LysR family transcriptional regulator [Gemmataceae bacterium]|nr:LysR family transcriptional regulator [Gemmataceae bacterium]